MAVETSAEILRDDAALKAHSHDWWPMNAPWRDQGKAPYRPDIVIRPRSEAEVAEVLSEASARGLPVTPWGLASSVTGGPLATRGGIVLDVSGMREILNVDARNMRVTVQAGTNGGELEDRLAALGLTLGHSPQSLYRSTVGGWLATRATGQFSSRYGGIENLCLGFRAVLADGTRVAVGGAPRMAVGPDLRHVLIGSEGCLGVITEVTLRLFPKPERRRTETLTFPSVGAGIEAMRAVMLAGLRPSILRFYDLAESRHAMRDDAFPSPVMFLACEGTAAMADAELGECLRICAAHGGEAIGPEGTNAWIGRRYDFSTIEERLGQPGGVAETIEVANGWAGIGTTYAELTAAMAPHATEVLGHFSHAYTDGVSLYVILLGREATPAEAEDRMRGIWDDAMRAALATGAVLSHHHGTGIARNAFVREALGDAWILYDRLKTCLDPGGILNPGKLGH